MKRNTDKTIILFRNFFMLIISVVILISGIVIFVTSKDGKNPPVLPGYPNTTESQSSKPTVTPPPNQENSKPEEPQSEPQPEKPKVPEWTEEDKNSPYFEEEMPILVNKTNKLPEDYKPDLKEWTKGYSLDKRAFKAYSDMYTAAQKDNISIWMVSAYRSKEKQEANFNAKVEEYKKNGMSHDEAIEATAKIIADPSTSEHSLGLAVDINSLNESFEETKQFAWLQKNCAEYGFILRYPKDKVDITGYSYEPWHYRYVGSNHAKIIMEKGISLEEYLMGKY